MPFLDHRIAEFVATIRPEDFLKYGLRKYILRESCKQYLPDLVYNRTDKIGFYTPLIDALTKDLDWVKTQLQTRHLLKDEYQQMLFDKLAGKALTVPEATQLWRSLSANVWMNEFRIS